jgi:hypothetical protein
MCVLIEHTGSLNHCREVPSSSEDDDETWQPPSIHLVLDNLPAHKAALMKRYVEPTNARLSVQFLESPLSLISTTAACQVTPPKISPNGL